LDTLTGPTVVGYLYGGIHSIAATPLPHDEALSESVKFSGLTDCN